MVKLYFITGNKFKFREAENVLPEIEQVDLDLPEIQEFDSKKIIEAKLGEALKENKGAFFCEDTSLYIDCLNGLPGPLIKWFEKTLELEGICDLVDKHENKGAVARTTIGYSDGDVVAFFEGEVRGKIVSVRGENGFGWDKIFMPEGEDRAFGEMTLEEKNKISMRKKALIKLKDYLGEVKK